MVYLCLNELFVVVNTDTTELEEGILRARKFAHAGADGVLVVGIMELEDIQG